MNNSISFKANYISSSKIMNPRTSKQIQAAFVELNPDSYKDREAIFKLNSMWDKGDTFAKQISSDLDESSYYITGKRFFALTLQTLGFENLKPEKILGVSEVITGVTDRIKLKYFQTHPDNKMGSLNPKYRGIGTASLNAIKDTFPKSDIVLESTESAMDFYKFNGFQKLGRENGMIFKR